MKTFSYAFGAGDVRTYPGGRYFRLMGTTSAVDVNFYKDNQKLDESAVGVEAGYYAIPKDGFDYCRITSAAAQTVKAAITRGTGGYDRTVGDVNATPVLATTIVTADKTIGTSATLIDAGSSGRQSVTMYNAGSNPIYVGPSGVTTANGFLIPVGQSFTADKNTAALYGIVAAGTESLRIFVEYT